MEHPLITKAFSVFDSASESFSPPFFAQTKGLAIRSFADLVNDPNTSVHKYPDQFTLFEIGEFHDDTGVLSATKTPLSCGLAIEFKTPA